jgi:hypothetical protein
MNDDEKRTLIERYLATYDAFDIDNMMSVRHPGIEFKNVLPLVYHFVICSIIVI